MASFINKTNSINYVTSYQLTMFPSEFCICLQDLEELNVANCHSKFGGIRINLGSLNLAFIPFEVKTLKDLRILNLRNNKVSNHSFT